MNVHKVDRLAGKTIIVLAVLYVILIASQHLLRPDIYGMINVSLEVFVGLTLVYIGARWAQKKLGLFQGGSKTTKEAAVKLLGFSAVLILLGGFVEYVTHNLQLTQEATADLRTSPDGRSALGEPIQIGWYIKGSQRVTGGGEGVTNFSIPVRGSKASGSLELRGIRKDGYWYITELYLVMNGNGAVVQIPH